ncbi:MAG: doxx family protein [Putridiphycobacter sp.]|nr:doxx family protein [Putridiphycobacter sp.]
MKKLKFLAISIGLIYIWFGAIKFFPGLSPAEELGSETVYELTLHLIPVKIGYFLLALLEVAIGIGLIIKPYRRTFTYIALGHMAFTFTPLILFPELAFTGPFAFTIVGQYIMKNIIIIMALLIMLPPKEKVSGMVQRA